MYISTLLINVGANPDRPRPGRLWLRNLYRVHQRLCMAFPSQHQRQSDPHFLAPYQPCGFVDPRPTQCSIDIGLNPPQRACSIMAQQRPIHVPRDAHHNFLFRVDPQPGNRVVILVQSALQPDWEYAFHNAREFLCARPFVCPFNPQYETGQRLRFRLRANPTKKVGSSSKEERLAGKKENGQRIALFREEEQIAWLLHKGDEGGFRIRGEWMEANDGRRVPNFRVEVVPEGWVRCGKNGHTDGRFYAVRFEGILEVTDPGAFLKTLLEGIGSAKGFGFGLLSLAPTG